MTIIEPLAATLFRRSAKLMGNRFEISIVGDSEARAEDYIDAAIEEIKRIERLLTTFSDDSQTNQINLNAGIAPVKVDREVFELIARSINISRITQGAFDISYGSIDKSLWNFDVNMKSLPDPEVARKSARLIDYKNIELDATACTVFLRKKGMRIGFGGIGKGYAADKARQLLQSMDVSGGVVNAAGDLVTWGTEPGGAPWTVAIADPDHKSHVISKLNISNMAVATSGNYEKYVIIDGKKYSHTIDPLTGMPVEGIKSVSIICPSAELADAMATPVMVMGVKVGLHLINQLKNIACIIVDDHNMIHCSKNINVNLI